MARLPARVLQSQQAVPEGRCRVYGYDRLASLFRLGLSGLCLLSLLACVGGCWAWERSYRAHDRVRFSTADARYTLHSEAGVLTIAGPPHGQMDGAAGPLAAAITNDDIDWEVVGLTVEEGRRSIHLRSRARTETAAGELSVRFLPGPGPRSRAAVPRWQVGRLRPAARQQPVVRPLLQALDDPKRAVAAHVLLLNGGVPDVKNYDAPEPVGGEVVLMADGLPVHVETHQRLDAGPARADPAAWATLRDQWHDRLDVPVWSVRHWHLVAATALPPLIWWGARRHRTWVRERRHELGLCLSCGYDLRASRGRCPECGAGTAVPHGIAE